MASLSFNNVGTLGAQTGVVAAPTAGNTFQYYILNESDAAAEITHTSSFTGLAGSLASGSITNISAAVNAVFTVTVVPANLVVGDVITVTGVTGNTFFNTTYTVTIIGATTITTSRDTSGTDFTTDTPVFGTAVGAFPGMPVSRTAAITVARAQRYDSHTDDSRFTVPGVAVFEFAVPAGSTVIVAPTLTGSTRHKTSTQNGEMVFLQQRV